MSDFDTGFVPVAPLRGHGRHCDYCGDSFNHENQPATLTVETDLPEHIKPTGIALYKGVRVPIIFLCRLCWEGVQAAHRVCNEISPGDNRPEW